MGYLLAGGLALLALYIALRLLGRADIRRLVRGLRWVVGGVAGLLTLLLLARGQVGLASVTGAAAFSILRFGRIGPLVFGDDAPAEDNRSAVRSRYFAMSLDHASGDVAGRVTAGRFRGRDLLELGEDDTRQLLAEVADDPDSLALLETWLDRNRTGWREYFAAQDAEGAAAAGGGMPVDEDREAYEILGLAPGASDDEIRAAHRALLKGVHPDQGGSTFLAAKINAARDRLLGRRGRV